MLRIASLSPAITEILFELGLQNQIVCRDQWSDYPSEVASIPKLKGHTSVDVPGLLEHAPDIVFTSTVIQEQLSANLTATGLGVKHFTTRTLQDIYNSITELGTLFAKEKEAAALVLRMKQALNDVQKKARLLPKNVRVYIEEWPNPPMASGNWVPELVQIAGGIPFDAVKPGELSTEYSVDQLQQFDPELIVLSFCGAGDRSIDTTQVTSREGFASLTAVQTGAIKVMDDSFANRPGPRVVEAAQHIYGYIFELLH